jgi:hypothetical protein
VANDGTLDSPVATVTLHVSDVAFAHDHTYLPPPADVTFTYTIPLPDGTLGGPLARAVLVAAAPRIDLLYEQFTGGGTGKVYKVASDLDGGYADLFWQSTAPNARKPLALVAGDRYTLVTQFSVDKPDLIKPLLGSLRPTGTSAFLAPALRAVTPRATLKGTTLTVTWTDLRSPDKASVNDTVDQQWLFALPGALVLARNTAKHQVYVLAGVPTASRLYHTVAVWSRWESVPCEEVGAGGDGGNQHLRQGVGQRSDGKALRFVREEVQLEGRVAGDQGSGRDQRARDDRPAGAVQHPLHRAGQGGRRHGIV